MDAVADVCACLQLRSLMRTCAGQWCACVRQLTSLSARALGGWRVSVRRGAAAEVCAVRVLPIHVARRPAQTACMYACSA